MNGPVLAGLFDLAIGTVGWLTRPDTRSATVTLAMTFLRPRAATASSVEARLLRAGTNLTFASAEILDERGEVTARCDGTVAVAHGKFESNDFYAAMRGRLRSRLAEDLQLLLANPEPQARPPPRGPGRRASRWTRRSSSRSR